MKNNNNNNNNNQDKYNANTKNDERHATWLELSTIWFL